MTETERGPLSPPLIAVAAATPALHDPAAALARALDLPLVAATDPPCTYLLLLTPERLQLQSRGPAAPGPIYADFLHGPLAYRRQHGGGRRQLLARAVGLKPAINPTVLDATAGLGRDGFLLAWLGCQVRLVERSPVIAALLGDGLQRATADPALAAVIQQRLQLQVADSRDYLSGLAAEERPDVVYLDPMYPHRTKTALVKKEMRLLRDLVGKDQDAAELLTVALVCARRRVAVKRPRPAEPLAGPAPDLCFSTESTRFDVYLTGGTRGDAGNASGLGR